VLIKDNHIVAAGSIAVAIDRCVNRLKGSLSLMKVEIEVKNMEEIKKVLKCNGIHRIMLDNFSVAQIKDAVDVINHVVEVEASGNVNLENVRDIADTGVDFISIGALTHSPKALDISLEIRKTTSFPS
ncbi:MAG TPA: nicotinate-nucleotide diphosphorylase (carboxylating), partial [Bacteroidota bacterium]|nr:nicotinate-nucleotide diphosphorylase (carboxylating) [Bacteroidota bacterium]